MEVRPIRRLLVALTAVVLGCTACGGDDDGPASSSGTTGLEAAIVTATGDAAVSTPEPAEPPGTATIEDLVLTAEDFTNLAAMTPVDGFFVDNRLGHLDDAVAIASGDQSGPYPVGTIIQLFPGEAMVKRAEGFDPASGDWEFFLLGVSEAGTEIVSRGGADVLNGFGVSCVSCHGQAAPASDFVCHGDETCPALSLDPAEVQAIQDADPRPHG